MDGLPEVQTSGRLQALHQTQGVPSRVSVLRPIKPETGCRVFGDTAEGKASGFLEEIQMLNPLVLEICAESLDYAIAAQRAGAHRIELCADLASGGITPSAGQMQAARKYLRIPIHVLIRPRPGDFRYSAREFEIMRNDIRTAKQLGMDGVVLGILDWKSRVDVRRTSELVELAGPLSVTFHRAFDQTRDLKESLEAVIRTGAKRILTSGGGKSAPDGLPTLAQLVQAAKGRIVILPGGGINASNISRIVRATSVREVHTSLGASALDNGQPRRDIDSPGRYEKKVRAVVGLLRRIPAAPRSR